MKLKFFLLTSSVLYFIGTSAAQSIAYIHRDSVLLQTPHYYDRIREIEQFRTNLDSTLKFESNALQQKANKLFSKYPTNKNEDFNALKAKLSPTDVIVLEELEATNKKLENKKLANQKLVEAEQGKKIVPIIDQINKAITRYAELNNIDIIYIIEDLKEKIAYINPKKNCTSDVIRLITIK